GDDEVRAGFGDDTVSGDAGNDLLYGHEGNDTLNGGDGDDTLDGGAGDDTLTGGRGADQIDVGVDGADTVVINSSIALGASDSGKGQASGGLYTGEDSISKFEWGTDVIRVVATGVNGF